jgi:predicted nucleotidyltransferase
MSKTIKYTINGFLIGGIINSVINALNQLDAKQSGINWNRVFKAFGKGGLIGGGVGFIYGAYKEEEMKKVLYAAGGATGFLRQTLASYDEKEYNIEAKASQINKILYERFNSKLATPPYIGGSNNRGTAIASSDIDIYLKFRKSAGTIEEIRFMVEDFFNDELRDSRLKEVRLQNCSIGLFFEVFKKKYCIDVVPLREIENCHGDTYLYLQGNSFFDRPSIKKTNSKKQGRILIFSKAEVSIVKLLKGWKKLNGIKLPTIYLELLLRKIFNEYIFPKALLERVLFAVECIGKKIESATIIDPANTNNIISNLLTANEKTDIKMFCFKMINEIRESKKNIIDYFPDMNEYK